jgi:hypothetical protein
LPLPKIAGPCYRFDQSDLRGAPIDLPYFDQGPTRFTFHDMLVIIDADILAR